MTLPTKLLSSDDFFGTPLNEEDALPYRCYLFRSTYSRFEFVVIESEMARLNDLLYISQTGIKSRTEVMEKQRSGRRSGVDRILHDEFGDMSEDVAQGIEHELPEWTDIASFIMPAIGLLTLNVFFEKSLKALCVSYLQEAPKPRKTQSKVDIYLNCLEHSLHFTIPDVIKLELTLSRRFRNDFAHGDWEMLREPCNNINLPERFDIVSDVLSNIEEAVETILGPTLSR